MLEKCFDVKVNKWDPGDNFYSVVKIHSVYTPPPQESQLKGLAIKKRKKMTEGYTQST